MIKDILEVEGKLTDDLNELFAILEKIVSLGFKYTLSTVYTLKKDKPGIAYITSIWMIAEPWDMVSANDVKANVGLVKSIQSAITNFIKHYNAETIKSS